MQTSYRIVLNTSWFLWIHLLKTGNEKNPFKEDCRRSNCGLISKRLSDICSEILGVNISNTVPEERCSEKIIFDISYSESFFKTYGTIFNGWKTVWRLMLFIFLLGVSDWFEINSGFDVSCWFWSQTFSIRLFIEWAGSLSTKKEAPLSSRKTISSLGVMFESVSIWERIYRL